MTKYMRNHMKKFLKKIALFAVTMQLFVCASAYASDASDLTKLLDGIKSMQANFKQIILDNYGKVVQQSKGVMALERPGKFRWQVKNPIPQLIIANKSKLWVYDPDLEQVTIRTLNTQAGEAPALLLSHDNAAIEKSYTISSLTDDRGLRWFVLKPKNTDNSFSEIKLGFSDKQIKEMILDDQIGHSTKIIFAQIKINQKLPKTLFVLNAPKGTDIIDETR